MPTISTCPRCSQMVSIPPGLDATTLVRCPFCGAEYPLDAAMDLVPPQLIQVDTFDDANLSGPEQSTNQADQGGADIIRLESAAPRSIPIQASVKPPPIKPNSPAETPISVAGLIMEPFFAADANPPGEYGKPPEPADKSGTGILPVEREQSNISAPPIVSSFLLQFGAAEAGAAGSHPIFAPGDAEETADTTESPLDDEVFDLITEHKEKSEKESSNLAESPAPGRRPQRKPKSELRIFAEIIFGGIVGLSIAYVAMAWFMGSQFPLPSPPRALKPVLRFVLPDRIWAENQQPRKNP